MRHTVFVLRPRGRMLYSPTSTNFVCFWIIVQRDFRCESLQVLLSCFGNSITPRFSYGNRIRTRFSSLMAPEEEKNREEREKGKKHFFIYENTYIEAFSFSFFFFFFPFFEDHVGCPSKRIFKSIHERKSHALLKSFLSILEYKRSCVKNRKFQIQSTRLPEKSCLEDVSGERDLEISFRWLKSAQNGVKGISYLNIFSEAEAKETGNTDILKI